MARVATFSGVQELSESSLSWLYSDVPEDVTFQGESTVERPFPVFFVAYLVVLSFGAIVFFADSEPLHSENIEYWIAGIVVGSGILAGVSAVFWKGEQVILPSLEFRFSADTVRLDHGANQLSCSWSEIGRCRLRFARSRPISGSEPGHRDGVRQDHFPAGSVLELLDRQGRVLLPIPLDGFSWVQCSELVHRLRTRFPDADELDDARLEDLTHLKKQLCSRMTQDSCGVCGEIHGFCPELDEASDTDLELFCSLGRCMTSMVNADPCSPEFHRAYCRYCHETGWYTEDGPKIPLPSEVVLPDEHMSASYVTYFRETG